MTDDINLKDEVRRKRIHYIGLSVPIIYFLSNRELMLILIGMALVLFFFIDYLRLYTKNKTIDYLFGEKGYSAHIKINSVYGKGKIDRNISLPTLNPILRKEERRSWGSHTYYALGALICILLYPEHIAIAATAILVIGDSVAALVGKAIGRHKIYKSKTLEGTLACFLSCMAVCYILLPLPMTIIGSLAATFTELFSTRLNDNFTIPVISGGIMAIANYFL